MTFREKFYADTKNRNVFGCPKEHGYEEDFDCSGVNCYECWDREMPETKNDILKGETKMEGTTRKTKKELLEEIAELKKEVERMDRYKAYDAGADDIKAMYDIYISKGFTEEQAFKLVEKMIDVVGLMNRG